MTNDHPNLSSKNPVFDIFVKHGKVLQLPMSIMAISAFNHYQTSGLDWGIVLL